MFQPRITYGALPDAYRSMYLILDRIGHGFSNLRDEKDVMKVSSGSLEEVLLGISAVRGEPQLKPQHVGKYNLERNQRGFALTDFWGTPLVSFDSVNIKKEEEKPRVAA